MRAAAIAGVFQTQQTKVVDRPQADLWWECARGACVDAGLNLSDIDGLVGPAPEGAGIRLLLPGAPLGYDLLGKPLRFHAASSIGAANTAAGANLALYAVASGIADVVVIVNAVAREDISDSNNRDAEIKMMARLSGPYEYINGTTRVSDYAVLARRHMHDYGTTPAQLAEVAVAQRHGATLHPLSVNGSRGELSIDDVLASRMIADPLRLLDCCPINQGGGAIVVTTAEHARSVGNPPIGFLGYGEGHSHIDPNALPSLSHFPAASIAAETAFGMAGLTPEDIDVAGIGDHFTINVIFGLEAGGFCEVGEGGQFVERGGLSIDGRLPTNTNGGYLSFSHAGRMGIYTLIELVEQLRNRAGPRQVAGAKYGYLNGTGGAMQNNFLSDPRRGVKCQKLMKNFLPEDLPSWQIPYWDALRDHRLAVQRCNECGSLRNVPKELCANCHSAGATWTEIPGGGEIYTYTVVHRAPTPAYQAEAPYVLAHVAMDAGIRMIGRVCDIDPEDVRIGLRVKASYGDVSPLWTLLQFEPET